MSIVNDHTPVNQVRLTNVAYVRLVKGGQRFEIACYRNKAVNWRNKIETDLDEVLQIQNIFTNVSKGMLASKVDLQDAFGTTDTATICKEILNKGDLQVSEQERQALYDAMFRDVASIVAEKAVNTETHRPFSIAIIQNAMKDIHYSISLSKNAKPQALDVIRKLRGVMPIARVAMLLRLTADNTKSSALKDMLSGRGAMILKEGSRAAAAESAEYVIEAAIDPEHFRQVEDNFKEITQGRGLLEILPQQGSLLAVPSLRPATVERGEQGSINQTEATSEEKKADPTPENDLLMAAEAAGIVHTKKQKKMLKKQQKKMALKEQQDGLDDGDSDNDESDSAPASAAANQCESTIEGTATNDVVEGGNDHDDEGSELNPEDPEVKYAVALQLYQEDQERRKAAGGKKSKKAKRFEEERLWEEEQQQLEKEERLERRREQRAGKKSAAVESLSTSPAATVQTTSATIDPNMPPPPPSASVSANEMSAAGNPTGKCNTCGASFYNSGDQRAHYRSDWHRINLKRKMKNLPLAKSEEEFNSLPESHWDVDIDNFHS